ncbi:unnamed protein product [Cyprideis torosa]|uniref:Uncharacterized protein n=1 Tax=Cyprideis torosa TaxID=163714 RepID=A0A7R8WIC6_9CRUS|nr:unnamed protein product [Cyprideis torosa]CAG0894550.1 unnamed protein product [Cyprideis torosa]
MPRFPRQISPDSFLQGHSRSFGLFSFALVACVLHGSDGAITFFLPNRLYTYSYETEVYINNSTEALKATVENLTDLRIKATVDLFVKKGIILQLRNIYISSRRSEEREENEQDMNRDFVKIPPEDPLYLPFIADIQEGNGYVKDVSSEMKDTIWSKNFKRGIFSQLVVTDPRGSKPKREVTIVGDCMVFYISSSTQPQRPRFKRIVDVDSCAADASKITYQTLNLARNTPQFIVQQLETDYQVDLEQFDFPTLRSIQTFEYRGLHGGHSEGQALFKTLQDFIIRTQMNLTNVTNFALAPYQEFPLLDGSLAYQWARNDMWLTWFPRPLDFHRRQSTYAHRLAQEEEPGTDALRHLLPLPLLSDQFLDSWYDILAKYNSTQLNQTFEEIKKDSNQKDRFLLMLRECGTNPCIMTKVAVATGNDVNLETALDLIDSIPQHLLVPSVGLYQELETEFKGKSQLHWSDKWNVLAQILHHSAKEEVLSKGTAGPLPVREHRSKFIDKLIQTAEREPFYNARSLVTWNLMAMMRNGGTKKSAEFLQKLVSMRHIPDSLRRQALWSISSIGLGYYEMTLFRMACDRQESPSLRLTASLMFLWNRPREALQLSFMKQLLEEEHSTNSSDKNSLLPILMPTLEALSTVKSSIVSKQVKMLEGLLEQLKREWQKREPEDTGTSSKVEIQEYMRNGGEVLQWSWELWEEGVQLEKSKGTVIEFANHIFNLQIKTCIMVEAPTLPAWEATTEFPYLQEALNFKPRLEPAFVTLLQDNELTFVRRGCFEEPTTLKDEFLEHRELLIETATSIGLPILLKYQQTYARASESNQTSSDPIPLSLLPVFLHPRNGDPACADTWFSIPKTMIRVPAPTTSSKPDSNQRNRKCGNQEIQWVEVHHQTDASDISSNKSSGSVQVQKTKMKLLLLNYFREGERLAVFAEYNNAGMTFNSSKPQTLKVSFPWLILREELSPVLLYLRKDDIHTVHKIRHQGKRHHSHHITLHPPWDNITECFRCHSHQCPIPCPKIETQLRSNITIFRVILSGVIYIDINFQDHMIQLHYPSDEAFGACYEDEDTLSQFPTVTEANHQVQTLPGGQPTTKALVEFHF